MPPGNLGVEVNERVTKSVCSRVKCGGNGGPDTARSNKSPYGCMTEMTVVMT